ncbi:2-dehydro-3-deoxygalactonokinase [Sphingobium herbicidovorans NBRC 16415]|uniref:2-dehydro-3-deoxygalactonokinase n=1 Tax=Sphingobium herbicidovorans (strain ATCC 700291 / DSM 11019 / CCUG 56400 / KCTC 2939 / LMG 18315 / NBRC 16415 / MH) TaxID=1219045 RepID=A0A086P7Y8_SPHHM|nr:2-dehydro-3-deoxygalactonokinase [Sphingobium herbicidovorans]KFG89506.1 2-dehydro-3-deoxygalactonokinase [Sphingobium herbicidovorans NBRC 16415]
MTNEFIAVDWGTTNRRAYLIANGAVLASEAAGPGVKSMPQGAYEVEVAGIRQRLGELPMLLVGMVGSTIGWREAPYIDAPASIARLATHLCRIDGCTAIVPGVADRNRPDVMRGEEVQMLGAVAAGLVPPDAILCQPGTHCKWATLQDGAISRFTTTMTGEIFALLKDHSLLGPQLAYPVMDDDAFAEGVAAVGEDLLAALFRIRAASVLGQRKDIAAASFASGLLIGSDVAARQVAGRTVHLLADPVLGQLYARAITIVGGQANFIDSKSVFVAGAAAIQGFTR